MSFSTISLINPIESECDPALWTGNFPRPQATGANIQTSDFTFDQSPDTLDVRLPRPFGFQMGMTDIESAAFTFTADFT
jgi:hypothetical protein